MGLAFSARLCQILRVLMHQTKRLVLPPRITDENRERHREVEHIVPAHTAAGGRAENWTPVVESGVRMLR